MHTQTRRNIVKKQFRWLLTIITILYLQTSLADVINLQDTLSQAVKTNPQIINKKNELAASGFLLEGAEWERFPTLSTDVNALESGANNATIRIEQPLWTGGRITGRISAAQASVQAAKASLGAIEQKILMDTASAYYDVLRIQSKIKIAQDNEQEHKRLVKSMARRIDSEISPKSDLIQAETRLQQASSDRIQLQNQAQVAKIALEQLLGQNVDKLDELRSLNVQLTDNQKLFEDARKISPERIRLESEVARAEADILVSRSQMMPSLVVGYQKRIGTVFFTPDNNQLYLGLRFNPGAGLASLSGISAASASKDAALNTVEAFDRSLMQETRALMAERNGLINQLVQVKASVNGADNVMQSYLRQFQVGRKNWLEVLNAQREKTLAYFAHTDIEFPLELTSIRLLILTGQIHSNQLDLNRFALGKRLYQLEPSTLDLNLTQRSHEQFSQEEPIANNLEYHSSTINPSTILPKYQSDQGATYLHNTKKDTLKLNMSRTLKLNK